MDDLTSAIPSTSVDPHQKANLIQAFQAFLPEHCILSAPEALRPYECDGLSSFRTVPMLVVLPETIEQVQAILRTCDEQHVPVVARGAGTGLSGGALPHAAGVTLGLAKFNQILDIDADNFTARVQPGVKNISISQAAKQYGLYYAPDPSSQIACSIGGNVAENAGGVHCLKYGLTVHNILEIKFITSSGELITVGGASFDNPGYDFLALLTGSEGMLGVIVEVLVKLLPIPEQQTLIMASFTNTSDAGEAVARVIGSGVIPAGLEMMSKLAIQATEAFAKAGYPLDAEAILLCELDGNQTEIDEQIALVQYELEHSGATHIKVAKDASEREKLWLGRKAAFPAVGRLAPDYLVMDGTIPRKEIAQVLNRIDELSAQYGLAVANVFHAGDGNLHPLILFDANIDGELAKAQAFGGDILSLCVEVGGSITGEHGVGSEKIDHMCTQFNDDELTQMHAIKHSFDPKGLLNPGKAVPTLHRCAEFGALHVHKSNLPFPDIPRF
ncbi:MAG: FAD-linked oxidase C-terminal domain-containing protein [bacterium]